MRLSCFCFGGFGATVGAVSVTPLDGGTDAFGVFSFRLFLPLSFDAEAAGLAAVVGATLAVVAGLTLFGAVPVAAVGGADGAGLAVFSEA